MSITEIGLLMREKPTGYNFSLLLRWFAELLRVISLILATLSWPPRFT